MFKLFVSFRGVIGLVLLIGLLGCGGSGSTSTTETPFITVWKTDNTDSTTLNADKTIEITTQGSNYNYSVDWGDGNISTNVDGNISHIYKDAGTYTVKISGDFPRIYNALTGGVNPNTGQPLTRFGNKLLSIEQWGAIEWKSMKEAFQYCPNLVINATDKPDLSNVTDMSQMFLGASKVDLDVSDWDVSNVTDMSEIFKDTNLSTSNYNGLLNSWSQLTLQNGVTLGVEGSSHTNDFDASRQSLIDNFGWTINDCTTNPFEARCGTGGLL